MKKDFFILLTFMLAMVSCNSHDFPSQSEVVEAKYNTAFVKTFGNPDSEQTWGFSDGFTRSVIKENHELPDGYVKPTLEAGEAEHVMNWFRTNGGEASVGLDWDKFFIVYVGGNTTVKIFSSWDPSNIQTGNVVLDYLTINGEHINDWNANNGPTVYVYNSKADNFTSHNSYCNLTTNKWKLARITYNGKVGYYVGLSAYGKKVETSDKYQLTDYDRENFYDDWVFKIVPANGVTPPPSKVRIIAEDLSAVDGTDFDFNDVVIDVNINGNVANCNLIAAGGTLPLRINGNDELEVHNMFGVTVDKMVNTGVGEKKDHVPFILNGITNSADIKLEVFKNGEWVEMKARQGTPAAKIAVNQDFKYCGEKVSMLTEYPNFKFWVQDVDYIWW